MPCSSVPILYSENAHGTRRQKAFNGATALGALTNNNADEVSRLLHTVCDKMTTPVVADMNNFPLVVGGAYSEEIVESVTYFFSNAVSNGLSSKELEADLKKGGMPERMVERFSEVFQMRKGELMNAAQKRFLPRAKRGITQAERGRGKEAREAQGPSQDGTEGVLTPILTLSV